MKAVDVNVVQELACSHIEERVDSRQSLRGRRQHHDLKTEDGLKSSQFLQVNSRLYPNGIFMFSMG